MTTTPASTEHDAYLEPEAIKRLADRLARIEGHVRAIRQMLLDHRCADEILIQVAAVKGALNRFTAQLVDQELQACVHGCMPVDERLERVTRALEAVLKAG